MRHSAVAGKRDVSLSTLDGTGPSGTGLAAALTTSLRAGVRVSPLSLSFARERLRIAVHHERAYTRSAARPSRTTPVHGLRSRGGEGGLLFRVCTYTYPTPCSPRFALQNRAFPPRNSRAGVPPSEKERREGETCARFLESPANAVLAAPGTNMVHFARFPQTKRRYFWGLNRFQ